MLWIRNCPVMSVDVRRNVDIYRNVFKAVHLTVVPGYCVSHLHTATNSACQLAESSAFPAGGDVDRALPVLPKHVELAGKHSESMLPTTTHVVDFTVSLHPSHRMDQNTSLAMSS